MRTLSEIVLVMERMAFDLRGLAREVRELMAAAPASPSELTPEQREAKEMADSWKDPCPARFEFEKDFVTLTLANINACRCNGSFTRATIEAFGVKYPPKRGWVAGLVGKRLTAAQYQNCQDGIQIRSGELRRMKKTNGSLFGH